MRSSYCLDLYDIAEALGPVLGEMPTDYIFCLVRSTYNQVLCKKSDNAEIDRRVHTAVKLFS